MFEHFLCELRDLTMRQLSLTNFTFTFIYLECAIKKLALDREGKHQIQTQLLFFLRALLHKTIFPGIYPLSKGHLPREQLF